MCDKNELNVHLDGTQMKRGDPLALVKRTLERRTKSRRKAGIGHRHSLLLIDTDRLNDGNGRSSDAVRLAEAKGLTLIRQIPCFEGVMLRLHEGHESDYPKSSPEAERRLRRLWPEHQKPMTGYQLATHFTFADLQRLAQADTEIRRLLEILGLPQLR